MKYSRVFYVCFRRSAKPRPWHIFTGNKRQHIFLITSCTNTTSVMIDTSVGGSTVRCFNRSAADISEEYLRNGYEVLQRHVSQEQLERPYFKLFRTCVSVSKDFLGIRKWWIVTPDQLYKEVQRGRDWKKLDA